MIRVQHAPTQSAHGDSNRANPIWSTSGTRRETDSASDPPPNAPAMNPSNPSHRRDLRRNTSSRFVTVTAIGLLPGDYTCTMHVDP